MGTIRNAGLLPILLLAACKSGGDVAGPVGINGSGNSVSAPEAFACSALGGGTATIQTGCVACAQNAIADAAKAIDTDLSTAAILDTYHPGDLASQETVLTLTATAQKGVVFPELSRAGVAMQAPVGTSDYYVTINALLDGKYQGTHWESPVQHANGEFVYFGFDRISQPFDALQLIINETQPSAEHHVYKVLEFCSDGALK